MKRVFDFSFSIFLILFTFIPFLVISLLVIVTSGFPVLFWSERIGKDNESFFMPKLRTMKNNSPQLATHLMEDANNFYTPLGKFLRQSSLDEIPQLFSVLKGKMSFVGPRPALFNQDDLIKLRIENRVHTLIPGVTGWAQVNGRDELTIEQKVGYETEYLELKSFNFDLYIIWLTIKKVLSKDGVSH